MNARGERGMTCLLFALERGDQQLVDTLLKAGVDVNDAMNPLLFAIREGNLVCIKQLISAGANVNMVTDYVNMPNSALAAASERSADILKILIEAGADVNIPSKQGGILAFSSKCTKESAIRLLRQGAKINVFNKHNVNTLRRYIADNHASSNSSICMLLFAAGESLGGTTVRKQGFFGDVQQISIPEFLLFRNLNLCLKHLCWLVIREHLLNVNLHEQLYGRVPKLRLPLALQEYLLYEQSLDHFGK